MDAWIAEDDRADLAERLGQELRSAILMELEDQGIADVHALAERLGAPLAASAEFFRRRRWPLETYLNMIEELNLPIRVVSQRLT